MYNGGALINHWKINPPNSELRLKSILLGISSRIYEAYCATAQSSYPTHLLILLLFHFTFGNDLEFKYTSVRYNLKQSPFPGFIHR
jgi:hypothetical protein